MLSHTPINAAIAVIQVRTVTEPSSLATTRRRSPRFRGGLVTFETWTRIGHEDAKALDYYRKAGNEIIELDESVQLEAKKLARAWAAEQAKDNAWFAKAWAAQQEFEELWKDAARYRNTKG